MAMTPSNPASLAIRHACFARVPPIQTALLVTTPTPFSIHKPTLVFPVQLQTTMETIKPSNASNVMTLVSHALDHLHSNAYLAILLYTSSIYFGIVVYNVRSTTMAAF